MSYKVRCPPAPMGENDGSPWFRAPRAPTRRGRDTNTAVPDTTGTIIGTVRVCVKGLARGKTNGDAHADVPSGQASLQHGSAVREDERPRAALRRVLCVAGNACAFPGGVRTYHSQRAHGTPATRDDRSAEAGEKADERLSVSGLVAGHGCRSRLPVKKYVVEVRREGRQDFLLLRWFPLHGFRSYSTDGGGGSTCDRTAERLSECSDARRVHGAGGTELGVSATRGEHR